MNKLLKELAERIKELDDYIILIMFFLTVVGAADMLIVMYEALIR